MSAGPGPAVKPTLLTREKHPQLAPTWRIRQATLGMHIPEDPGGALNLTSLLDACDSHVRDLINRVRLALSVG